jgi:predicted regulator of Ras-like GTPase activity (Roadblock/LC7/MglB family)
MPIPFLDLFKKLKNQTVARKEQPVAPKKVAKPLEKPSSERFSKTVMPNATRALSPQDPFQVAARSPGAGVPMPGAGVSSGSRTIAMGATAPTIRPSDFPPAVALALEPMVERVIALDLADIAEQIPPDYIKPLDSIDGTRRILLKACEVEKGMASRKPAVSLATVYEQVPEIFLRSIVPSDETQVHLPFQKVLEQFANLQVRSDQERFQAVPQVETPFLKATLEDNSRFGTVTEPVEMAGDILPVRLQPATAETLAAAEPEAAGNGMRPPQTETEEKPSKSPRTPFKLSPNGTDGSAPESVPASSGPSVPTSVESKAAPTRIPFKIAAPGKEQQPPSKHESCSIPEPPKRLVPPVETQAVKPTVSGDDTKIILPIKPILRGVPPSQFVGDAETIPAEAQIELPFSAIEPQLSTGRIALSPTTFAAALPQEYRTQFNIGDPTEVILPLQEVLKNLPSATLRIRTDQEEEEAGASFATPFSAKAEEDAKRFNVAGKVAPAPAPAPAARAKKKRVAEPPVEKPAEKPAEAPSRSPLQTALDTDENLDDKAVVAHINKLPGMKGCALMFGDGLSLAGSLPPEYGTEGLCAMAPTIMQRIEKHMVETKLGTLRGMTLSCEKGSVTFFMHANLCLAALHTGGELAQEVQEKLARVVHELSKKYSNPV